MTLNASADFTSHDTRFKFIAKFYQLRYITLILSFSSSVCIKLLLVDWASDNPKKVKDDNRLKQKNMVYLSLSF